MERSKKPWLLGLALFLLAVTIGLWLNDWFIKKPFSKFVISPQSENHAKDHPLVPHPILDEQNTETTENNKSLNTKPTPKSFMQNQGNMAGDTDFRFKKEDYMNSEVTKKPDDEDPDFFETEYDMDFIQQQQALSDAQKKINANMGKIVQAQDKVNSKLNLDLQQYKMTETQTERFAIKLQFPDQNEAMKLKLNYREAPNFGASNQIPEPILPEVKKEEHFIEIERSKTSESPWNTFNRQY